MMELSFWHLITYLHIFFLTDIIHPPNAFKSTVSLNWATKRNKVLCYIINSCRIFNHCYNDKLFIIHSYVNNSKDWLKSCDHVPPLSLILDNSFYLSKSLCPTKCNFFLGHLFFSCPRPCTCPPVFSVADIHI